METLDHLTLDEQVTLFTAGHTFTGAIQESAPDTVLLLLNDSYHSRTIEIDRKAIVAICRVLK